MSTESFAEQLARVEAIASSVPVRMLLEDDLAALRAVLESRRELLAAAKAGLTELAELRLPADFRVAAICDQMAAAIAKNEGTGT